MRCAFLVCVVVAVIAFENVSSQYVTYRRSYFYDQRRPYIVYPASSGVIRTFVSADGSSERDGALTGSTHSTGQDVVQKVRLDVYYETDCPDSMRFITRELYPLYQEMEDALDIHLVPYGKASEQYNLNSKKYDFRCHHGPSECYGNTVQSCAMSLYPRKKDYMNFIYCMETYPKPSVNGHKCARRLSLDWNKIDKCAKGDEGNRLLHKMAQLTESLDPKLYFVPWIVVDKVFTESNQRKALRDLKSVVCTAYKGNHPKC